MAHPFQDKLIVFIGMPVRCKRKEVRDALVAVGGVPDEKITAFTKFVVAFDGAESTKAYKRALRYSRLLTILTEDQFLDILEGKAMPPEEPESDVIVIPSSNDEALTLEHEQFMIEHLTRKRINSMARHGVQTPEGRVKVDMRPLEKMVRVTRFMNEQKSE